MGNKLVKMIERQALRYGDREAYRFCWRKEGEWLPTSWEEFRVQIDVAGRALCAMGLKPGERIAICSPNTPQVLITEFGAFRNRAAAIPVYFGSSQEQFDFIAANGNARIIFVGDKGQYPLAYSFWKTHPAQLLRIVVFKNVDLELQPDDDISISWDDFVRTGIHASEQVRYEVEQRAMSGQPDDLATLIYTSGTTGEPKGVEITHANYDAAVEAHFKILHTVTDSDLSMSFLPMSHILEKAWCYFCLSRGIRIAVNYDPRIIQDTIHHVHPNLMCCVPRFWEKVYVAVRSKLAGMNRLQRVMVSHALRIGHRRNLHYRRLGLKVPRLLEMRYRFWDRRLFAVVKRNIGIPNPNMFPTAGAPLSDRIAEFFLSIGIDIKIGYGLSETTATVSCFPDVGYEIGTVGVPLPGLDVKISDEGEILVKGPTVTRGYYKNAEANAQAFTPDGYFRTGDAGYLTPSGALVLTERIKDLFKTANGKYIAPQALESHLAETKYIDEVAVIGEGRKYVSALIVPNFPNLRRWADSHHISYADTAELLASPKVQDFMMSCVEENQQRFAPYERIKRIALLPHHFSVMNGEVTNTLKVRRPVVAKRYAAEIESMYPQE